MAHVYTLAGLGGGYDTKNFGGAQFREPNIVKKIDYNNRYSTLLTKGVALKQAELAVELIDQALHEPYTDKEFWGHSKGGEMIEKWLRDKGPTSDVDPATVKFFISGSPENKYGGTTRHNPDKYPPVYGGVGVPEDTPYEVWYITRQYDAHADYPAQWESGQIALDNLKSGNIHSEYEDCRLLDGKAQLRQEGNIRYLLIPTPIMPLAKKWWFFGITAQQKKEDAKLRPGVESAYDNRDLFEVPS